MPAYPELNAVISKFSPDCPELGELLKKIIVQQNLAVAVPAAATATTGSAGAIEHQ